MLSSVYLLTGCSGDKDAGPWAGFKPLNEIDKNIEGYYNASLGEAVNPKSGNPAVYIDFSDGLIQAYKSNSKNSQIIQAIAHKLISDEIDWYSLGNDTIKKLEYKSTELFNKINDPKEYKDIMAPIEKALIRITSDSNDALLITDFEEYTNDRVEQFLDYPKKYFINWLRGGNSITFFYTSFHEINKSRKPQIETDKHLYFTVFTHGKPTPNSFVSQIKDAFKGRIETEVFELNNSPYNISNDYGGKDKTGISNQTFAKWVNYNLNSSVDKKLPFEVIGINKPWNKDLEKYVENSIKKEAGLFLNGLLLNASDQSAYKLSNVSVKVYDVSDDYENYARCSEAKNHVPVLIRDSKKDFVWDEKSKKDAIIEKCYLTNTTDIKKAWIYKSIDLSKYEWAEVFDYNKEIFSSHLKNDPAKIGLETIFHPNYKIKNVKKENALIRIDYVIGDAIFNDSNPKLSDFQWTSSTIKDKPNTSLSEAIRNTLLEPSINPKGKIIYSYYIKFANTKKP